MSWLTWPLRMVVFITWYVGQIVVANTAVLRDNITPGQDSTPGIAKYESRCVSAAEITVLAALITLTPGTLTLGTEKAEGSGVRVLFVHGMYADDADALRREIHHLESRLLRAIRREGESR